MRDNIDSLWEEREEMLREENSHELECLCEDFGQDECPVHSTRLLDMIMMTEEEIEKLSKPSAIKDIYETEDDI